MAISTRNSVLGIRVESTEGTPVLPAAVTDFTAIQDDADMESAFESLANAEVKGSIGTSKPILGAETPSFSFSHYLRHSGVEGQAPDFNDFLKGAFGAEDLNATEYDTVAASTVSVIKVDTGEGVNFQRGQALLIKDATNGYNIRAIESVSGDNLTLGFNVPVAPALGVNLGKAVLYYPVNTGHQSLSVWLYQGNGGALEMMSGAKVTSFEFTAEAGQLVNSTYSVEGLAYYFNPITLTATDTKIDFTDDDGTFAATLVAKTYKDPHTLASAIASAMNATASTEVYTCVYSDTTGKFTLATGTSTLFSILWNTGANTANTLGDKIGFSVAADDTGATTYTSDNAVSFAAAYTPTYDSADPLVAKYNSVLFGDATDTTCFSATSISFALNNTRQVINDICSETGVSGSLISERTMSVTLTGLLSQYEAKNFKRFKDGDTVKFQFNFGPKDSSGNWTPGKCVNLFLPSAVISSFNLADQDGLVALEMELAAFVDNSGNGEGYLNFV